MLQVAQWIAGIATGLAIVLVIGLAIDLMIREERAERRSKRREQQTLAYPPERMLGGEWACRCSTCSPLPDGPNPSSLRLYGSSTANPVETPTPSATAAIPSAYSSSGTGGFDTRGRVLTIGLTPMSTPELLTPSTAMTSSGTTATGGTPGRASREAARLEKRD